MDSFWENRKKSKNGCFLATFGLILAVSHIPAIRFWCLCTRRGPFGCRMTVQNFVKIGWTVFEKFEIFMKRSGEKKTARLHERKKLATVTVGHFSLEKRRLKIVWKWSKFGKFLHFRLIWATFSKNFEYPMLQSYATKFICYELISYQLNSEEEPLSFGYEIGTWQI